MKRKKNSIIPLVIFFSFVAITVVGMVNKITDTQVEPSIDEKIWEEAYKSVEENKAGIDFKEITTTEDEYMQLRLKCNEWVENESNEIDTDNISVDTLITEEVYIDNNVKSTSSDTDSSLDEVNLSETGPIYFQDMIVIRYIDENGTLKMVSAIKENDKYTVIDKDKLEDKFGFKFEELGNNDNYDITNDKLIPQDTYLSNIGNIFINILNAETVEEAEIARIEALRFFTKEGRETVLSEKTSSSILNNTKATIQFMATGKSDNNLFKNDRIYMRLIVNNNENVYSINVILKINANGMIFDTDII